MGHVLKDFVTGTFLVTAGLVAGIAVLIIFFILGLFFHVLAIFASALFFVMLLGLAVWFVGFAYRKAKEIKKQ
jgi:Flp pilus assembly protein TadB